MAEEQKCDKTPTQHEQSDPHATQSIEAFSNNTSLTDEDSDDDGGYRSPKPLWRFRCCSPSVDNKCIEDWSCFTLEVLSPIRAMIVFDDDIEFKSILHESNIKFVFENVVLNYAGHDLCAYGLLAKLCYYGASKCARALLSHEAGSTLNLNIENCYGNYPLNAAAMSLSPDLVKILVDHGAVCESPSWISLKMSPLDYAVGSLSCSKYFINWSLQKSVYKLIITLCLPQMREARETISFLAGVAASHTLFDTIFNAVRRGQIVAVAALLLLARDKVLSRSFSGSFNATGSLVFHKAIKDELAAVINQKYALMGKKDHTMLLKLCVEKEELLIHILQLLEIFTRAGPELDLLLENNKSKSDVLKSKDVSRDVAKLLKNAFFTISDTDIIDTSDSFFKSEPVQSEEYNAEDDPEDYLFKPSRDHLCQCGMYNPTCASREVFMRIAANRFSYAQHRGLSSHAGPSVQKLWAVSQRKVLGKVELGDKRETIVKEKSGKWLEFQMSKRIVRSGSVLMAALRRGVRGV
ncbi:hypothetical protein POM88_018977 [Heracleum sosnowskyi]|uniref:Uncharacterized protein n=1 Tax=Heracleum sosnowskyi TaxID=360622 RepID=A0AAD8MZF5_9APIA|nr:hypothetical protein POM88_018977 [Heracleum sosnowskyi]